MQSSTYKQAMADSHLNHWHIVYFKCLGGSNMKQVNHTVVKENLMQ